MWDGLVAFGPFQDLHYPPSPHTFPHNHVDRLKSIPNEKSRRSPLAYYASAPGTDGLYRLLCIRGINIRDPQANCRSKVRVASCYRRKTAPSRLSAGPGIGNAEEVLGVVDLHRIAVRHPPDGVPEGMIRMGNNSDASLLVHEIGRLLRAEPSGRDLLHTQNQQKDSVGVVNVQIQCLSPWTRMDVSST
jgi:hypothetical protein